MYRLAESPGHSYHIIMKPVPILIFVLSVLLLFKTASVKFLPTRGGVQSCYRLGHRRPNSSRRTASSLNSFVNFRRDIPITQFSKISLNCGCFILGDKSNTPSAL
jgi:hypothetical protein